MNLPKINYGNVELSVRKIAYDLALVYARTKLEKAFREGIDFDNPHVSREIEELEYLNSQFLYAISYLSEAEPGEIERKVKAYADGELPLRV